MMWGVVIIFSYPLSSNVLRSLRLSSIFWAPSSIPGRKWLCISTFNGNGSGLAESDFRRKEKNPIPCKSRETGTELAKNLMNIPDGIRFLISQLGFFTYRF
jgi:hypothetical protein